eukprot:jgi/Galph1/2036/GphlegSOOS_G721.1
MFYWWPIFMIHTISLSVDNNQLLSLVRQQQLLYQDLPLPVVQVAGTHNSYSSTSYGYHLCNNGEVPRHFLSLTEQLDKGFRLLELDVHYVPQLKIENNTMDSSAFRLCHGCGSGCFWLSLLCLKRIPDYGEHRGCSKDALTLEQALKEIVAWLMKHPEEFVFVYLDSFINHVEAGRQLNRWVEEWTYPLAFSRQDLFNWRRDDNVSSNDWPSIRQLLTLGKQMILDSRMDETVVYEQSFIFPDLSNIQWPYSQLQYLKPMDEQSILKYNMSSRTSFPFQSIGWMGCSIVESDTSEEAAFPHVPYFSRMIWEGHLSNDAWYLLSEAIRCGYSFRIDIPSFSTWKRTFEKFQWSYSTMMKTSTIVANETRCFRLTQSKNWLPSKTTEWDVSSTAPFACVCEELEQMKGPSNNGKGYRQFWWVTLERRHCIATSLATQLCNASKPSYCKVAKFTHPVTAFENEILKIAMKRIGTESVWIIANENSNIDN